MCIRDSCWNCGSIWDNRKTSLVASFMPNNFKVYDMSGNVWQWVQDAYSADYTKPPRNGEATAGDARSDRVVRGGSWRSIAWAIRPGYRDNVNFDGHYYDTGFRIARKLEKDEKLD